MSSNVTERQLVIGVDVGGTKVAAGVVDAQGKILARTRAAMNCRASAEEGLASVLSAIESLLTQDPPCRSKIKCVGICAPGPLDPRTGVIINPPNVPGRCRRRWACFDRLQRPRLQLREKGMHRSSCLGHRDRTAHAREARTIAGTWRPNPGTRRWQSVRNPQ